MHARSRPPLPAAALAVAGVAAVVAAACVAVVGPTSPSSAQTGGQAAASTAVEAGVVAGISEELSGVVVTGRAPVEAQAAFEATLAELEATVTRRGALQAELLTLDARDEQLTHRIATETQIRKGAATEFVLARGQMQEAAVSSYMATADIDDVTAVIDVGSTVEIGQVVTYSDSVRDDRLRTAQEATREVARASAVLDESNQERVAVRERATAVRTELAGVVALEAELTTELEERTAERDRTRALATVAGTDFSLVALDAYWRAAAAEESCGLAWWMLAGISRVEGRHGTYRGTSLLANGDNDQRIIGIALTGEGGTAAIGDSDGGTLDGDAAHDRAVGPMQFIPSTWRRFARDGDGDGDRDPQNLYDATAAAAAYLCHGRQVDSEAGLRAGYFSYNHSQAYVDSVLAHAYGYRELVVPDPVAIPGADAAAAPTGAAGG